VKIHNQSTTEENFIGMDLSVCVCNKIYVILMFFLDVQIMQRSFVFFFGVQSSNTNNRQHTFSISEERKERISVLKKPQAVLSIDGSDEVVM